jgi:TolB-like protein
MSIWTELKRRKVLRVASAYFVIAWVIMQLAALLEETLELPGWFDKLTLATLLLGFPISLLLAWAYDIHPDSAQPTSPSSTSKSIFIVFIVALVLAGSGYSFYLFRNNAPVAPIASEIPSIAVLPFADMSPEGDQAWFADGVSEEILNVLAKAEGFKVASRTSSFKYRGELTDLRTVGDELDVAHILEGSVRSQGDRIRITAQLINTQDGFHAWSQTYDRNLSDIFKVQDEISVAIANALMGELGVNSLPQNRFKGTNNVDAYTAYLKGLELYKTVDIHERLKAEPFFLQAIELDPDYLDAWAALANVENLRNILELNPPTVSSSLKRVLNLDPDNAEGVATLAHYNAATLNWLEAEQLYLRGIDLQPENGRFYFRYASFLNRSGRFARALEMNYRAEELGYQGPNLAVNIIATHNYLGQFAQAREYFEKELARVGPDVARGNIGYFVALLAGGMEQRAREFSAKRATMDQSGIRMRYFLERMDGRADAEQRLIDATFVRIEEWDGVRSGDIEHFVLAGDLDLAREYAPQVVGYGHNIPSRLTLYIDDEIDPRYLPYRGNLMLIVDMYPGAADAYMDIGVDIMALAREKGYLASE